MVSYISHVQGPQHISGDALVEGLLPGTAVTGARHVALPALGTRPVEHRVPRWGGRPQTEAGELRRAERSAS
jgi:hypothetical protein